MIPLRRLFFPVAALVINTVLAANPAAALHVFDTPDPLPPTSRRVTAVIHFDELDTTPGDDLPDAGVALPYRFAHGTIHGDGKIVDGWSRNRYVPPEGRSSLNPFLMTGTAQEPGPVTIAFTQSLRYFGLYVGSLDAYNSIQLLKDGAAVATYSGSDLAALLHPVPRVTSTGNYGLSRYFHFQATQPKQQFNTVVLSASQGALEVDNLAYRVVPSPALLPGVIGMGVAALRRRRAMKTNS
ncbi:MAG: PTPA-CTERM sorting domain-containing protein [Synechococcales cyanobacterium C42_A2020_086]|nr:PTPA-CTERM sorting domain-containing protein [Synechococcales cyanobacterium C42_A2020_086]